jgi:hypothetical protein
MPWFRETLFVRSLWLPKLVRAFITRKRYVVLWVDAGEEHAQKLTHQLRRHLTDPYVFQCIASPERVRRYPRWYLAAVILIDTDVTKLAETQTQSQKIEQWLENYVKKGGALVGAHDVLWRRVRAPELEKVLGGRLTRFDVKNDVDIRYQVCAGAEAHPLTKDLAGSFTLSDGEVCFGTWQPAAKKIYADADHHPLVVAHEYFNGRCVWLNSGDFGETIAVSVGEPQDNFRQLVVNAIQWTTKQTGEE